MQINADRLATQLASGLAPLYLIAGDEPLLVQEARDAVRAEASKAGIDERHVLQVERADDWQRITAESDSLGLFASRRLFDIRLEKGLDAAADAALTRLVARPNPDDVLLISCSNLDKRAQAKAWFKAFDRVGVHVQIWPVRAAELPRWLDARARRMGIAIDRDALRYLSSQVEGNLLAAAQQLDLLKLLGAGPWTVDAVARAVDDAARFEAFALFDAACAGDAARVLQMLRSFELEGEHPLPVLSAFASQLRRLIALQAIMDDTGESFERAAAGARIFGRDRLQAWQRALSRASGTALTRLLPRLATADQQVKGMLRGDPWQTLMDVALALAACPPNVMRLALRDELRRQPIGM